jgi:hypothetical protein
MEAIVKIKAVTDERDLFSPTDLGSAPRSAYYLYSMQE